MSFAAVDLSGLSPLPITSSNAKVREVLIELNKTLRSLDDFGCFERYFELASPTPGYPGSDYATRPWNWDGRTVVIVEGDHNEPGFFWINLSVYSMPPELEPSIGYVRRLVHLATAKVYGQAPAWCVAAQTSCLLGL